MQKSIDPILGHLMGYWVNIHTNIILQFWMILNYLSSNIAINIATAIGVRIQFNQKKTQEGETMQQSEERITIMNVMHAKKCKIRENQFPKTEMKK